MLSKKHQLHPLYRLYPDIRIPNNNKLWSPVLCRLYLCNSLLLSGSESRWCVISDFSVRPVKRREYNALSAVFISWGNCIELSNANALSGRTFMIESACNSKAVYLSFCWHPAKAIKRNSLPMSWNVICVYFIILQI